MNINWKVRIKSKAFWVALIPAVALLVQAVAAVFGLSIDLSGIGARVLAVVEAAFVVLSILGIVVDPTTKGLADSARALGYDEPNDDTAGLR